MQSKIESGSMSFAIDVYRRLKRDQQNLVFSPFSITTALSMTLMGCRRKTGEELSQTLFGHVIAEKEFESLAKHFNVLVDGAVKANGKVLSVANFMYQQRSFGIVSDFKTTLENNFAAKVVEVDFTDKRQRKEAVETINKDVSRATCDKVKQLLQEDDVNKDTRLILVNAVYFKGSWQVRFSPENTKICPFTLSSGEKVDVMLMSQESKQRFCYSDQLKCLALKLPFEDDCNTSMIVLLPDKSSSLESLESSLTQPLLDKVIKKMRIYQVTIKLPKFKLEAQHDLIPVLKQLGINELFGDSADLSGMAKTRPHQPLFVSNVIQKAVIQVNEEGAEAAAATAVTSSELSMRPLQAMFRADHPFLFLLVSEHQDTKTILFMGAVEDPRN